MSLVQFKRFYDAPWINPEDGSMVIPSNLTSSPGRLRGGQSVDIQGFFAILYNILKQEDPAINFLPAYPDYILKSRNHVPTKDEPVATLPNTITFKVVRKTCGSRGSGPRGRRGIKPTIREEAALADKTSVYTTYGQCFKCIVQLDCWASTRYEAEILAEYLEDLILKYTGLIKTLGIQEVIYEQRLEDEYLRDYGIPGVSIQWLILVEKIWYVDTKRIEEIRATFKVYETLDLES